MIIKLIKYKKYWRFWKYEPLQFSKSTRFQTSEQSQFRKKYSARISCAHHTWRQLFSKTAHQLNFRYNMNHRNIRLAFDKVTQDLKFPISLNQNWWQNKRIFVFKKTTMSTIRYNQTASFSQNLVFFVIRFPALRDSCSAKVLLSLWKATYSSVCVLQFFCHQCSSLCWFPWEILYVFCFPRKCYSWEFKSTFWNTEFLF